MLLFLLSEYSMESTRCCSHALLYQWRCIPVSCKESAKSLIIKISWEWSPSISWRTLTKWDKELLHKRINYGIPGRFLLVIKSFLLGKSIKVVVNGQSFGVHNVVSLKRLSPQSYHLYINYQPKNTLRFFINADDMTVHFLISWW